MEVFVFRTIFCKNHEKSHSPKTHAIYLIKIVVSMTFCRILGSPPKFRRNDDFYKRNRMCFGVGWWGWWGWWGGVPRPPRPPCGVVRWAWWGDPRIRQSDRNDDSYKINHMCFGSVCLVTIFSKIMKSHTAPKHMRFII